VPLPRLSRRRRFAALLALHFLADALVGWWVLPLRVAVVVLPRLAHGTGK
jgi:hypothetical protein